MNADTQHIEDALSGVRDRIARAQRRRPASTAGSRGSQADIDASIARLRVKEARLLVKLAEAIDTSKLKPCGHCRRCLLHDDPAGCLTVEAYEREMFALGLQPADLMSAMQDAIKADMAARGITDVGTYAHVIAREAEDTPVGDLYRYDAFAWNRVGYRVAGRDERGVVLATKIDGGTTHRFNPTTLVEAL